MSADIMALPRPSTPDAIRRILAVFEAERAALAADPSGRDRAARLALYDLHITRYRGHLAEEKQ